MCKSKKKKNYTIITSIAKCPPIAQKPSLNKSFLPESKCTTEPSLSFLTILQKSSLLYFSSVKAIWTKINFSFLWVAIISPQRFYFILQAEATFLKNSCSKPHTQHIRTHNKILYTYEYTSVRRVYLERKKQILPEQYCRVVYSKILLLLTTRMLIIIYTYLIWNIIYICNTNAAASLANTTHTTNKKHHSSSTKIPLYTSTVSILYISTYINKR